MNSRKVKYQSSFSQLLDFQAGRDTRTERANSRGENGQNVKMWFCFLIFTFSEPTVFLRYARRKIKTESRKRTVPKEAPCCFSSEYGLPLLLGGFQIRGGGRCSL